jgi:phospholipid/cholesterol/gamma-HCH transport system substrate-binding protein
MKDNKVWVGILVLAALFLLGSALFLVGDQHKAFRRHVDFFAEFANLSGITKGAKVRVSGMDGGQVAEIQIPSNPAQKFRLKLVVDERLHGIIRNDSLVSVETQGIVGDEFVLIKSGSDNSPEAQAGATLPTKEPFDLTKMLDRANGLMTQVGGTLTQVDGAITDLQGRLDGTLDTVTATVKNTNGIVTTIREGRGAAGVLLQDPKTAEDVKAVVGNTRQATANLNTASMQVNSMLDDVQRRQLVAKVDDTLSNTKGATQQLNATSQQLHETLTTALAQDQYGQDAGQNLQQTLSNVNAATGNLADDTEALKHEFFFKGFFKKRGYDNLDQIPVATYRSGELFKKLGQNREWIDAKSLFAAHPDGSETLTPAGRAQIDEAVSQMPDLYDSPIIVEGYADAASPGQQLLMSRQRAALVQAYLVIRYHIASKNIGIVGMGSTPPVSAGKTTWDGVSLVRFSGTAR